MPLVLIGLNHETASLPARERVAYSPEEAVTTLRRVKEQGVPQALLLSTCNRTELYAVVADPEASVARLTSDVFAGRLAGEEVAIYRREDDEAVRHLFRVSCGLDSQILGEQEILGQVKDAYSLARRAETAGTLLHRLASGAFRVGKRARSETRIGAGAMSVAYAAVELAEKVFQKLEGRGALLIGAGENGALCAKHLLARRVDPFFIANRTLERAEALARAIGGEAIPLEEMEYALARADIVVSTTGASELVLHADRVRSAMRSRGNRPLIFVDIALPRDIDPEVDGIYNVFRFDMEALNGVIDQNLAQRKKEVVAVERLVQTEVEAFIRWWRSLAAGPVIADLHAAFEKIREDELKRNSKRFVPEDREQLDVLTRTLVRKLLMGVTTEIKAYSAENPVEMERLAALRRAFHLDGPEIRGEEADLE